MAIPPAIYRARREKLLAGLDGAVVLVRSNPEQTRSNDTEFPFRQDSDFHYLTGFDEPDAALFLRPAPAEPCMVLFVRPRDPDKEVWNGRRAGVEGALRDFGADAAHPIDEFDQRFPDYLDGSARLLFTPGIDRDFNDRVEGLLARLRRTRPRTGKGPAVREEVGRRLHELRLVKGEEEVVLLRRACAITAEAHERAMREVRPGAHEYEIEALLNYLFRVRGGNGPGYNSIVAGGENATILHYTENRMRLEDGQLLLIDAGAEVDYYTADVTRTFPVGERFSEPQRAVYEIVLAAQLAGIDAVRPGVPFEDVHRQALEVLVEGLVGLGVLRGTVEELIAENSYRPFYMHRTSHWLGLDVHDAGSYVDGGGRSRALEPGMVLTVEPGLYFGDVEVEYDARYRGIGVRIEDDVLVTATGHEVLSAGAPKRVEEIEALRMRPRSAAPVG